MPGIEVHLHRTFQWAVEAGLHAGDASAVAAACLELDILFPGRHHPTRHYPPLATTYWMPHYLKAAIREERDARKAVGTVADSHHLEALRQLGWAIHCAQDRIGHGRFGERHHLHNTGKLKHNPDEWEPMPEDMKAAIEAATKDVVARYLAKVPNVA